MSDVNEPATPGGLSFERAEFENQHKKTLSCGYCKKPLDTRYWQIAKRPACADCRELVERELVAGKSPARFGNALGYGALAALAGSVGWLLVEKVANRHYAIVAIGVAYLVGKAVRKGARSQGGPRYQALAVFLTYSAIVLAQLPLIIELTRDRNVNPVSLIALAYELPFSSVARAPLDLVVIGIGLYQAWKLTRALPLQVLGPFPIEPDPPAQLVVSSDATH